MSAQGAVLFAQYAYPPNELGHCGPPGAEAMLRADEARELEARARRFEGAWSYLEVLAEAAGVTDPLDEQVVEAYWVGNGLLDIVEPEELIAHLSVRFRGQVGGSWRGAGQRALAHHSFQVFEVYPWAELLRAGRPAGPAVQVLDDCRIRVGRVERVEGESVIVTERRLVWAGDALQAGEQATSRARWRVEGRGLIDSPQPGDLVALHWDWVCARIDLTQADQVVRRERAALDAIGLARPATVEDRTRLTAEDPPPS